MTAMTDAIPKSRWYHPTPDRFVIGLLVVVRHHAGMYLTCVWFWASTGGGRPSAPALKSLREEYHRSIEPARA